ncbi:hypothetical protein DW923_01505 [Butyricicoccus sp. AM42-5AC]|jgi:hypothetical protein|uniref:hypothetical protein n=3 Tax=Agathobaculum sp. TaxID=2048138 RepID=UPI000E545067|nr:hypothetical protein DW923_01505 [Butyricicoccus sp. AM42-5AC]
MASKTTNYGLNKHSPQDFYNVEARNENWDKIDEALAATDPTKITAKAAPADGDGVMIADSADGGKAKRLLWSNVKAALGKLFVPLARKINGKALAKDVTLTGDDIAMGADDAETLRAAMAKRLRYDDNLGLKIKLKAHKSLEYMSFDSGEETDLNYSGGCLALPGWRSGPWGMQLRYDMRWNTLFTRRYFNEGSEWDDWVRLATCMPPEVHELPLAAGWARFDATCRYYKTQESIVIVSIAARTTQSFRVSAALATLPEGFRPAADLEVPAIFKSSRRLVTIKATADGNLFVDLTDQSGVAITSDDYFFATFAFAAT